MYYGRDLLETHPSRPAARPTESAAQLSRSLRRSAPDARLSETTQIGSEGREARGAQAAGFGQAGRPTNGARPGHSSSTTRSPGRNARATGASWSQRNIEPRNTVRFVARSQRVSDVTVATADRRSTSTAGTHPAETWNTPEAIAEHRAMTPEQRVRKAIELSRAVLRLAKAPRVDDR